MRVVKESNEKKRTLKIVRRWLVRRLSHNVSIKTYLKRCLRPRIPGEPVQCHAYMHVYYM